MARATACACCARATCATQTLDEIAFDRSACGAAARGDVEALREALARRPASADEDGTTTNASGYTPLHHAARRGCARCVKACLELGCDARATTRAGRGTALHKACAGGARRGVRGAARGRERRRGEGRGRGERAAQSVRERGIGVRASGVRARRDGGAVGEDERGEGSTRTRAERRGGDGGDSGVHRRTVDGGGRARRGVVG